MKVDVDVCVMTSLIKEEDTHSLSPLAHHFYPTQHLPTPPTDHGHPHGGALAGVVQAAQRRHHEVPKDAPQQPTRALVPDVSTNADDVDDVDGMGFGWGWSGVDQVGGEGLNGSIGRIDFVSMPVLSYQLTYNTRINGPQAPVHLLLGLL